MVPSGLRPRDFGGFYWDFFSGWWGRGIGARGREEDSSHLVSDETRLGRCILRILRGG